MGAVGGVLPQGRYWAGLFGFFAGASGLMLAMALIRGDPGDDPGAMAALFVPTALLAASMSRVTVYATPTVLVVRTLVWKRHIDWVRIVGFRVRPYRFGKFNAASVVACTDDGLEIRIWATMTRSRRRALAIAAAIEALAAEHGISADIDPAELRCHWI